MHQWNKCISGSVTTQGGYCLGINCCAFQKCVEASNDQSIYAYTVYIGGHLVDQEECDRICYRYLHEEL